MKTGWKTVVVVMAVLVLVGGLVIAGPGGGPGWGRGPAHARGPGMGPGMGMGMGMGPQGIGPMGPPHSNALGAIGAWLDLTDEQKTQIREIQEQARKDAEAAQDAVADARDALHEAVVGGATEAEIRAAATTLGEAIGNQAALHAKTAAAAKAVLTEEQRKEFDKIRTKLPGMRQSIPHGPGPFCPWVDDTGPIARPRMNRPGFGGGPLPVEEMFKAADTDKDGKLTLEELQAFRDSRRGAPQSEGQ